MRVSHLSTWFATAGTKRAWMRLFKEETMASTRPLPSRSSRGETAGPTVAAIVIGAALLAALAVSAWSLPPALVLPAFSLIALGIACAMALLAWRQPGAANGRRVSYWDLAGALTFLGLCAAILSEPEQVLPLLEEAKRDR
jgi:uncharacterized membrane protein (DUF4010 family)